MRTTELPLSIGRRALLAGLQVAAALVGLAFSPVASARTIANNTPKSISSAQDLGPASATEAITVTVWLQAQASEQADAMVARLYDRHSPQFHRWLAEGQANALAPSAAQAEAVQRYLAEHNLRVLSVDEANFFVRAQGTIADVQKAFHVNIHRFTSAGRTFRANTSDPTVDDPVGAYVAAVAGLSEHRVQPHVARALNPDTGQPFTPVPATQAPNGAFFSAACFRSPQRVSLNTSGALPAASYFGNRYGADITNTALGTLAPCGYQPSELQTAYNLNPLYAAGLDGTGETVVIVDAIGSPSITSDAEVFSQVYGLPDLTSANFNVYFPGGAPPAPDTGWASETTLDVEWSHSIAPKASIALVIAPTSNDSDLQAAILFAIHNHLGHVISNSYGEAESDEPAALIDTWNQIIRFAASRGISVNFSSGDGGDSNPSGITAGLVLPGVSLPASSPWATAVGGTSLALDSHDNLLFQAGWGTNLTRLSSTEAAGLTPIVPPLSLGFIYGAGGGVSGFFPKPFFQYGLHGSGRLVPDVAFLADPYTGVEIICDGTSCNGLPAGTGPIVEVIGGTSLACPMFSGLWSIANQATGGYGLGQAARILYSLPPDAFYDVRPVGSRFNVEGATLTSTGFTFESADTLAQPLYDTHTYMSALYQSPSSTRWYAITFGTDSSLKTDYGWDNVTGLGTPNGKEFVEGVVWLTRQSKSW